jgi:hypothetical protein
MHSQIFYDYCVWNDETSALRMLNAFSDIDILYDAGGVIRSICTKNNPRILKATLDYFENRQFPQKDAGYHTARSRLIEILEECDESVGSMSETHSIISEYIGSDIACLDDVAEAGDVHTSRASSDAANNDAGHTVAKYQTHALTLYALEEHNRAVVSDVTLTGVVVDATTNLA